MSERKQKRARVNSSENSLVADGLPEPPELMNATAKAEWSRVAAELHAQNLLPSVDRSALTAYCMAYARWTQAETAIAEMAKRDQLTGGLMIKTATGGAVQNPLVGTSIKAAADMVRYAAEFGLSPSHRATSSVERLSGAAEVVAAKRGRPSIYSQETADRICREIASGASLRAICAAPEMPHIDTVRKWLAGGHEEFLAQYVRAREEQADYYADEMVEIADTTDDPQKARLQIDARKWKASKLAPKKYGEKIQHAGHDGGALTVRWEGG
jgi:P27 family predicted phage terminase small subunit